MHKVSDDAKELLVITVGMMIVQLKKKMYIFLEISTNVNRNKMIRCLNFALNQKEQRERDEA